MAVWTLPLPTADEPLVTQSMDLQGRSYLFRIDWNGRTDRWTFGITDVASGSLIISGGILAMGVDLLRILPESVDFAPPGEMWVGGIDDPSLETTGAVTLFYIDVEPP